MFVSTGNNFGAGQIRFKSYQAENYLVLNANFSFLTGNPDYQAAEVLEISVPTMRIDRSVEVGVFVGFRDRRQSYGSGTCYDGCTLARSWIKDSNTICIEKLVIDCDCLDLKDYVFTLDKKPYHASCFKSKFISKTFSFIILNLSGVITFIPY